MDQRPDIIQEFSGSPISVQYGKDFRPFLWLCFQTMGFEPYDIQYEAANWLATSGDRVVFSCMREFGKTITIAAYICWKLDMDNDYLFVVQCANSEKAESIVRLVKQLLLATPELQYLYPGKDDINSATKFDVATKTAVTRDASVSAYGAATQIAGTHVHEVIADDLETRENSLTDLRQERLLELIREYEDLLFSDKPGCRVIIIGTPQTQESIYFKLMDIGYEMMRLPSRYPDLSNEYVDSLAPWLLKELLENPDLAGSPTFPERKSEEFLVKKEMLQGQLRFSLQELLDPSLADASKYPLKLCNLIVYDSDLSSFPAKLRWSNAQQYRLPLPNPGTKGDGFYEPQWMDSQFVNFVERIMWVDPSGSGTDEVAWSIGFGVPGYIYIPEVGGRQDAFSELTYQAMAMAAKKYQVQTVYVEPNNGGGAYRKSMEEPFRKLNVQANLVDDKWTTGQKEPRIIDTLLPVIGQHRLVISKSVAEDHIWGHQFSHLLYIRGCLPHDDRIESTWGVVKHLMHFIEQDTMGSDSEEAKMLRLQKVVDNYWGVSSDQGTTVYNRYGMDSLGL